MVKLGKLFGKNALSSKATQPSKATKVKRTASKVLSPVSTATADPPGPRASQIAPVKEPDNAPAFPSVSEDHRQIIEERSEGIVRAAYSDSTEEEETRVGTNYDAETMDEDFTRMTDEDQTFDDGTFCNTTLHDGGDAVTYGETALVTKKSDDTTSTAKGDDPTKKYFHKDVVLNSLDEGMNNLVIRAMYFVPKPKRFDHVVVKVEVSWLRRSGFQHFSQVSHRA